MSNGIYGLLIILFAGLVSVNLVMAMMDEPVLLAWLNQILLGTILIAVVSHLIVSLGTRKMVKKVEED